MDTRKLTNSVFIDDETDAFGRDAEISFEPDGKPGWRWKRPDGVVVPLTMEIVSCETNRIVAKSGPYTLHTLEHIIAPRPLIPDGVVVWVKEQHWPRSGCWPPTDGGCGMYWRAIEERGGLQPNEHPIVWKRPRGEGAWNSQNGKRSVTLIPNDEDALTVDITIDYPGLSEHDTQCCLPRDIEAYKDWVIPSKSQGLLLGFFGWTIPWRVTYWMLRLLQPFFRFVGVSWLPRVGIMNWPHLMDHDDAAEVFLDHRVLDFIAALMIPDTEPERMNEWPALRGRSVRGGHAGDITARKSMMAGGP